MIEQATHNYPLFVKKEEEVDRRITSPNSTITSSPIEHHDYDAHEPESLSWKMYSESFKPIPHNKQYRSLPSIDSSCLDSVYQQALFESISSNLRYSPLRFPSQIPSGSLYEDNQAYFSYINSHNQSYQNPLEELLKQKLLVELKIDEELAKIRQESYLMKERSHQMINNISGYRSFAEKSKFAFKNKSEINYVPEYNIVEINKRSADPENLTDTSFGKKVKIANFEAKSMLKEIDEITESKPQQSKWKNFPGHVMFGIKRGCQSYFGEEKGIKLKFIERILSESKEAEPKFKEFIDKYKSVWKTYQTIIGYINKEGDKEIANILMRMIIELLSEENSEDFEAWLDETRMNERTKEAIRNGKETIKKDFISRLCQKNSF